MAGRWEGGGSPPIARVIRMIETESIEDENGVPFLVIYGISGNTHRFWSLTNASRRAAARPVTPAPTTTRSARHLDRLRRTRSERNADEAQRALAKLAAVCADPSANTMPHILDAVNAWCSVGEIMSTMSSEFGEYRESVVV